MSDEPAPSFRSFVTRYFKFRTPASMICDGVILLVLHMIIRHAGYVVGAATARGDPREELTTLQTLFHPAYLIAYAGELAFHLGVLVCAAGVAFEAVRRLGRVRGENAENPPGDGTVMP